MESEDSKEEQRTLGSSIKQLSIVANKIDILIFGEGAEKTGDKPRPMPDNKISLAREEIDEITTILRKAVSRLEVL